MYVVTADEMRRLDQTVISDWGIPALVLMENAGRAVAEAVRQRIGSERKTEKAWIVLVGKGNNGADGIVAARHLAEAGIPVHILYAVEPHVLEKEAAVQRDIAARMGLSFTVYSPGTTDWAQYGGILDGLLGTGSSGAPREPYASLIREANFSGLPIVAIDIPSGLDADTGQVHDPCIRADMTVALAFLKRGLTQYPGKQFAGETVVRPIGIPPSLAESFPVRTYAVSGEMLRRRFGMEWPLARQPYSHKGTYGHVLVIAGSAAYSGAGLLCASAAMRAGAGLVTWALPQSIRDPFMGRRPELMLRGIPDDGRGSWPASSAEELIALSRDKQAVAIGPGLSRFAGDQIWLRKLWQEIACPIVLDADALNILADAGDFGSWPARQASVIMTPHPGELARLTGLTVREVEADRIELARRCAQRFNAVLVLKGAATVTATPQGDVYINTNGNPGMATGGTGDVLAGIIASLLAQGLSAAQAAAAGVYWHAEAGDRAAARRAQPASLLAGDLIEAL
jgi:NAD(P)H-hydrate epimerase